MPRQQVGSYKDLVLLLIWLLILSAPSNHAGRNPILIRRANRQDAGLAALGQGWPFAAARRINVGLRVCRAPARDRVVGQERFAYFCAVCSKVRRCKSATLSSRYRRNGYVLRRRPTGTYRNTPPIPAQRTAFIALTRVYSSALKISPASAAHHGNQPDPKQHQGPVRALRNHSGVSLTTITNMIV